MNYKSDKYHDVGYIPVGGNLIKFFVFMGYGSL